MWREREIECLMEMGMFRRCVRAVGRVIKREGCRVEGRWSQDYEGRGMIWSFT